MPIPIPVHVPIPADQFTTGISNEITIAVIALIGILLGGLLTFLTTLVSDYKRAKREREQYLFDKRIACYSKAIEFISFLMTFPTGNIYIAPASDTVFQNSLSTEKDLYRFYNEFVIFAKKPVIKKFNSLRELLLRDIEVTRHNEAYQKLLCVIQKESEMNSLIE